MSFAGTLTKRGVRSLCPARSAAKRLRRQSLLSDGAVGDTSSDHGTRTVKRQLGRSTTYERKQGRSYLDG